MEQHGTLEENNVWEANQRDDRDKAAYINSYNCSVTFVSKVSLTNNFPIKSNFQMKSKTYTE